MRLRAAIAEYRAQRENMAWRSWALKMAWEKFIGKEGS